MSSYPMHILAGGIATTSMLAIVPTDIQQRDTTTRLYLVITVVVFSILPDIDHKASKVSIILHLTAIITLLWVFFDRNITVEQRILIASIFALEVYHRRHAQSGVRHRQFPHSYTFLVLASFTLFLVSKSWLITSVGFICCLSHLVLDQHLKKAWKQDKSIRKGIFK